MLTNYIFEIALITLTGLQVANAQTTGIPTPPPGPYCGNNTLCVAFSVAMNDSHGEGIINYNQVLVNEGNGYSIALGGFTAPDNGYYWTHISVGVESGSQSEVYTLGTSRLARLTDGTVNTDVDTLSRDEIFFLGNLCGSMQALSLYPVYSDELLQTSMTGFSIATVSQSAISFSVALSSNTACSPGTRVPFDVILHDTTPNGWDNVNKHYRATKRGTFVFNLMVGSNPGLQQAVGLYVNVAPTSVITGVQQGSTDHDVESQSQLVAVDLEIGYSIYAACGPQYNPSYLYGSRDYQTILSGFFYEPAQIEYAWSVASTTTTTGLVDPLPMPVVLNNKGQFWNQLTHVYEVKRGGDGVYYMHVTAGINTAAPCQLDVMLNDEPIFNVYRPINNHNGVKTRSRAILYTLYADEVVKLRVPAGATVYSSQDRITMFTGFRLYAI